MARGKSGGSQLRLAGGFLRGRRLAIGPGVRPTEGRVREALFSIWQQRIPGSCLLDLFAGSGAVGLEALSRGAQRAVFVESSARVLESLRRNLSLASGAEASVQLGRLPGWLGRSQAEPFDLIFADPPYRFDEFPGLLKAVTTWMAADGELAIEHSTRVELPAVDGLSQFDQRTYGESRLTFFR